MNHHQQSLVMVLMVMNGYSWRLMGRINGVIDGMLLGHGAPITIVKYSLTHGTARPSSSDALPLSHKILVSSQTQKTTH